MEENGFLNQFYSQTQHNQPSTAADYGLTHISSDQQSDQNFNWLITEPPPTVHAATPLPAQPATPHTPPRAHPASSQNPMSGDYKFHHQDADVPLSMNADDLLGASILTPSVHQQPLHSPMSLQQGPFQTQQYRRPTSSLRGAPIDGSRQHRADTYTKPSPESSADLPSMQQTSALMALIPRLDTTPSTLRNVQYTGPHTAPILPTLNDDAQSNPRLYHFGSDSNFDSNGFRPNSDLERHDFRAEQLTSELRPAEAHQPNARRHARSDPGVNSCNWRRGVGHGLAGRRRRAPARQAHTARRGRNHGRHGPLARTQHGAGLGANGPARAAQRFAVNVRRHRSNARVAPQRPARDRATSPGPSARTSTTSRSGRITSPRRERRNQIRIGFEELHRLVPDLQEGGLSKSNVLMESASFLRGWRQATPELGEAGTSGDADRLGEHAKWRHCYISLGQNHRYDGL